MIWSSHPQYSEVLFTEVLSVRNFWGCKEWLHNWLVNFPFTLHSCCWLTFTIILRLFAALESRSPELLTNERLFLRHHCSPSQSFTILCLEPWFPEDMPFINYYGELPLSFSPKSFHFRATYILEQLVKDTFLLYYPKSLLNNCSIIWYGSHGLSY